MLHLLNFVNHTFQQARSFQHSLLAMRLCSKYLSMHAGLYCCVLDALVVPHRLVFLAQVLCVLLRYRQSSSDRCWPTCGPPAGRDRFWRVWLGSHQIRFDNIRMHYYANPAYSLACLLFAPQALTRLHSLVRPRLARWSCAMLWIT